MSSVGSIQTFHISAHTKCDEYTAEFPSAIEALLLPQRPTHPPPDMECSMNPSAASRSIQTHRIRKRSSRDLAIR